MIIFSRKSVHKLFSEVSEYGLLDFRQTTHFYSPLSAVGLAVAVSTTELSESAAALAAASPGWISLTVAPYFLSVVSEVSRACGRGAAAVPREPFILAGFSWSWRLKHNVYFVWETSTPV